MWLIGASWSGHNVSPKEVIMTHLSGNKRTTPDKMYYLKEPNKQQ